MVFFEHFSRRAMSIFTCQSMKFKLGMELHLFINISDSHVFIVSEKKMLLPLLFVIVL